VFLHALCLAAVHCLLVQETYHQWDCRVLGVFAVNSTAHDSSAPPLASTAFSQDFDMYLTPGSSGPAAPSLLLLLASALLSGFAVE